MCTGNNKVQLLLASLSIDQFSQLTAAGKAEDVMPSCCADEAVDSCRGQRDPGQLIANQPNSSCINNKPLWHTRV